MKETRTSGELAYRLKKLFELQGKRIHVTYMGGGWFRQRHSGSPGHGLRLRRRSIEAKIAELEAKLGREEP